MEILNLLTPALLIGIGSYELFFNRQASLSWLRWRKATWKRDYTAFDVRVGRAYAKVIGMLLLVSGVFLAAKQLF